MTKFSELTDIQKGALCIILKCYPMIFEKLKNRTGEESLTFGELCQDPDIYNYFGNEADGSENRWLKIVRDELSDIKIKSIINHNNKDTKNIRYSGLIACELEDGNGDITFIPFGTEEFKKNYKQFLGLEKVSIDQLDNILSIIDGDSNQDQEFTSFAKDRMINKIKNNKDAKFYFLGSSKGGLIVQNTIATVFDEFKNNIGGFTIFNSPTMNYTATATRENFVNALNTPGVARIICGNDDFVSRVVVDETYKDMVDSGTVIHAKSVDEKASIIHWHDLERIDFSNGGNVTNVTNYKKVSPKLSLILGALASRTTNMIINNERLHERVKKAFHENTPWYGKIIVRRPGKKDRFVYASTEDMDRLNQLGEFEIFDSNTKVQYVEPKDNEKSMHI